MAARDIVLAVSLIFIFSLGFFIVNFVGDTMVTNMVAHPEINSSNETVAAFESIETSTARLDYLILALFVGLTLGIIITGWFIAGVPLFMFIYFCVVVVGVILSTILSNVWEAATGMTIFGSTISAFPIANNLMMNLPIYASVIGFIGLTVMFAKPYFMQN